VAFQSEDGLPELEMLCDVFVMIVSLK